MLISRVLTLLSLTLALAIHRTPSSYDLVEDVNYYDDFQDSSLYTPDDQDKSFDQDPYSSEYGYYQDTQRLPFVEYAKFKKTGTTVLAANRFKKAGQDRQVKKNVATKFEQAGQRRANRRVFVNKWQKATKAPTTYKFNGIPLPVSPEHQQKHLDAGTGRPPSQKLANPKKGPAGGYFNPGTNTKIQPNQGSVHMKQVAPNEYQSHHKFKMSDNPVDPATKKDKQAVYQQGPIRSDNIKVTQFGSSGIDHLN